MNNLAEVLGLGRWSHLVHNVRRVGRKSGLKLDPSRTGLLVRRWNQAFAVRFGALKKFLYELVVVEDSFGLDEPLPTRLILHADYRFATDPEKLKIFRTQVEQEVNRLFQQGSIDSPWVGEYITAAYKKGMVRAFDALARGVYRRDQKEGATAQFLRSALSDPETVRKVELLAARAFEDMRGLTENMKARLNRELAQGLVQGKGVRALARNINDEIAIGYRRAKVIAATETIRAHAEGQLEAFKRLGIDEVGVEVEWSTAGDESVCPLCAEMQGTRYKVDEASGLIPAHPRCRCTFIPVIK